MKIEYYLLLCHKPLSVISIATTLEIAKERQIRLIKEKHILTYIACYVNGRFSHYVDI